MASIVGERVYSGKEWHNSISLGNVLFPWTALPNPLKTSTSAATTAAQQAIALAQSAVVAQQIAAQQKAQADAALLQAQQEKAAADAAKAEADRLTKAANEAQVSAQSELQQSTATTASNKKMIYIGIGVVSLILIVTIIATRKK